MNLEDLAFEVELGGNILTFEEIPTKFIELLEVIDLSTFSEP
jgi:hypothetical protein